MRIAVLTALLLGAMPVVAREVPVRTAPLKSLVKAVDIPHTVFTLPNGLRVIVHTDRKAPIVAVSVWYHIGSKDEPKGKTGFAHLFEHLMFYGSENNDGVFFKKLENVGATNANGTTWFDRTNYFENVPTPALELALFFESDRMGHLLGAVTQAKLDAQRAVVQNEKRQSDNNPLGLTQYATLAALFPEGHPYRHSTIGSMADLDAASLGDVQDWFRANYGPNNAVLVLAGDIDSKTAKTLVTKYFGAIPRGPEVKRQVAPVPVWTGVRRETLMDRIPTPRISRNWVVPGQLDAAASQVDTALAILAGGASSRLYNDLVRDKKLAVGVSGGLQAFEKVGMASISATVAPGVDPAAVEARIDTVLAEFLANGPTADEVSRVATRVVSGTIRGLEQVGGFGGKAVTLAEGAVYAGDPNFYKAELARYAAATPASVKAAANSWLTPTDYRQTVLPGERPKAEDAAPRVVAANPAATPAVTRVARMPEPVVGASPVLATPRIERAMLANGVKVELARRDAVPVVRMLLSFNAGQGADDRARLGIQNLALGLLDEGAAGMTGPQIAEAAERLGASIGASAGADRTRLVLDALKPNLDASLQLFASIARKPEFPAAELERVRGQVLAGIDRELSDPGNITRRMLPVLLYGPAHPYGVPSTGTGTPEGVKAVTRDYLIDWHKRWIRPDNATIHVVGDIGMGELLPLLNKHLGDWTADAAVPRGTVTVPMPPRVDTARIILVDRPGSPQSYIRGGVILPVKGREDRIALGAANDILGGLTTSRLNTNIREEKGWAYGVGAVISDGREDLGSYIIAPVQADRTGDALAAMIGDVKALRSTRPITDAERETAVNNVIRALPGDFESGGALLGALERNAVLGRPDDYYTQLVPRMQALTTAELNAAAAGLSTDAFTWVVVGDRKIVEPQLKQLGLPVEVR